MKRIQKTILSNLAGTLSLLTVLAGCTDKGNEKIVSTPVIVSAELSKTDVTYGDEVTLTASIKDEKVALSTLDLFVEANDVLILKKSIRTKGNEASVNETFSIPFIKGSLRNSEMKIRLEAININGNKSIRLLENIRLVRPDFPSLTLIIAGRPTSILLTPRTGSDDLFESPLGSYANTMSFRIYQHADKSGYQWADLNGVLNLCTDLDSDFKLVDPTMTPDRIVFDMQRFELYFEGIRKDPMSINGTPMISGFTLGQGNPAVATPKANADWMTATINLTKNQTVPFVGVNNIAQALTADWFEVTGSTCKFLGESGSYTFNYHIPTHFFYIEQISAIAPAGYWIRGWGIRRSSSNPSLFQTSWDWNYPYDYVYLHKTSSSTFEAIVYIKPNNDADGGVNCKLFTSGVNWGDYIVGVDAPLRINAADNNILASPTVTAGKYRLVLSTNAPVKLTATLIP